VALVVGVLCVPFENAKYPTPRRIISSEIMILGLKKLMLEVYGY